MSKVAPVPAVWAYAPGPTLLPERWDVEHVGWWRTADAIPMLVRIQCHTNGTRTGTRIASACVCYLDRYYPGVEP